MKMHWQLLLVGLIWVGMNYWCYTVGLLKDDEWVLKSINQYAAFIGAAAWVWMTDNHNKRNAGK